MFENLSAINLALMEYNEDGRDKYLFIGRTH